MGSPGVTPGLKFEMNHRADHAWPMKKNLLSARNVQRQGSISKSIEMRYVENVEMRIQNKSHAPWYGFLSNPLILKSYES
jgi:hypothetical protein